MSKFNLFIDNTIIFAQEDPKHVRLWGQLDTNLEWVEIIGINGRRIEVKNKGKSGRRHYIECLTDILPIKTGSAMVLLGTFNGSRIAHNCIVSIGSNKAPESFPYEYSLELGTLA